MGSAEAPNLLPKELKAVGLDGKERDISLVAIAYGVFRKLVWDGHDGEEGVRRVLDESDQALDEALKSGGWARNESIQCSWNGRKGSELTHDDIGS